MLSPSWLPHWPPSSVVPETISHIHRLKSLLAQKETSQDSPIY